GAFDGYERNKQHMMRVMQAIAQNERIEHCAITALIRLNDIETLQQLITEHIWPQLPELRRSVIIELLENEQLIGIGRLGIPALLDAICANDIRAFKRLIQLGVPHDLVIYGTNITITEYLTRCLETPELNTVQRQMMLALIGQPLEAPGHALPN
ncbi:MAG TPA: hypothetical protein PLV25_06300, partial [Opitutales bacterium]|nr:hypothetical protein [Opitutales bacterium]